MTTTDTGFKQPPSKRAKVANATSSTTAYVSHPCGLDVHLWLQIASGLEFGEMIQFTSACKLFFKEVAPMIEKIKVMSSAHMHVIPARRFSGVKKAIVACLVKQVEEEQYEYRTDFDEETALRFQPLLTAFPQLTYAMIGGNYFVDNVVKPYVWWRGEFGDNVASEHRRLLNAQLSAVCGAYRSGLFSSALRIDGLFSGNCGTPEDLVGRSRCLFCESVCRSMPIDKVASLMSRRIDLPGNKTRKHSVQYDLCHGTNGRLIQILTQERAGGLEYMLSPEILLPFVFETTGYWHEDFEAERKLSFLWWLKRQHSGTSFGDVVRRNHVEEYLSSRKKRGKELRIPGHFLEFLQDEGFPLECDDFDIIYDTSLDHKSKYDKYPMLEKEDVLGSSHSPMYV